MFLRIKSFLAAHIICFATYCISFLIPPSLLTIRLSIATISTSLLF